MQKDVVVTSVAFGDTHFEIGFIEARDQTADAGLMKSIALSQAKYADRLAEVMDLLEDIIDDGLLEIRNPPEEVSIDPRKRIKARAAAQAVEEEDPDEA